MEDGIIMNCVHKSTPYEKLDLFKLNICGRIFEIRKSTASKHHGSLFGILASEAKDGKEQFLNTKGIYLKCSSGPESPEEWYTERSATAFELILDFLRTGHLHAPHSVCKDVLKKELIFWRLRHVPLADCCWADEDEDVDIKHQIEERRRKKQEVKCRTANSTRMKYFRKLRLILTDVVEQPHSSNYAKAFTALSIFFIITAVVNLVISTIPALQTCTKDVINTTADYDYESSTEDDTPAVTKSPKGSPTTRRRRFSNLKYHYHCEGHIAFEIVEAICVAWFTLEYILRFTLAHNKCKFVRAPLNIIDLLAVVPFYIDLIVFSIDHDPTHQKQRIQGLLSVLRTFRIFRLFNVVRLARYSESLKIMAWSIWRGRNEFGVLILFIGFTITIFASIVFFCEKDLDDTDFQSIPATFWWAVVTVTTVGYGDMVPKSIMGKIFASVSCVMGIVIMAFPVSILVENFNRVYKSHSKKSSPKRVAILISANEIGVTDSEKLPRIAFNETTRF